MLHETLRAALSQPFAAGFGPTSASLYFGAHEGTGKYRHSTHSMFVTIDADGAYSIEVTRENKKYGGTSGGRTVCRRAGINISELEALVRKYTAAYGSGEGHEQEPWK